MYFITAMTNLTPFIESSPEGAQKHASNCCGYFHNKSEAIDAVMGNRCDLFETCFHYIVIEYVPEGIYPIAEEIAWYKYSPQTNQYEEIKKPKETHNTINYCFG